ncbi:MAG: hydrogenase maturation protease [Thermoplasmata archaeon]|jgi:hydrogenase maturation protease|nr:hydrogenase maturation protease [Thermoplasmata archaeon]
MPECVGRTVKTLLLGVGNPILSDDGAGIHAARMLKELAIPGIDVDELPASGLELLDVVLGYDRVIIVDAIKTEGGRPGDLYELREADFARTIHGYSPHGINIPTALAMGRSIVPERMPKEVLFFAIEADDIVNVSEELTPKVAEALPGIVKRIEQVLRQSL